MLNFSSSRTVYTIGLIVFFLLAFSLFFTAPKNFLEDTIINIKEGQGLRSISFDLKAGNFIRSRVIFEAFIIIFGGEKYVPAGDYFFEDKLPVFEVARRLSEGERHLAPIKVTIP